MYEYEPNERDYIEGKKNYYWHATDDNCYIDQDSCVSDRHHCKSKCEDCHTGATGCKGDTGCRGATGATGTAGFTTQLRGLQVQLQDQEVTALAPGDPVIFDETISDFSAFISYNDATGEVTISQTGVFYINWWVSIDGIGGGADKVITLGIITSAGDNIQASTFNQQGQIIGNALISVIASPVTLQLVNVTDGTIDFGLTPIKADLTIINVTL